jgi:hypothetical protein
MRYVTHDWEYLLMAYGMGGACNVPCPAIRASLQKAGLMTPAKVNYGRWGPMHHAMALTKKGRLRAQALREQSMTDRQRKWERRLLHTAMARQEPNPWRSKWWRTCANNSASR